MTTSQAQSSVGNQKRSLAGLRELLHADPANRALWRQCSALAADQRDYAALEELARVRLAVDSADLEARFNLATALIGLKRPADALPVLAEVLEGMPDDGAVLANMALCHYSLGQFADAAVHLKRNYAAGYRDPGLLRLLVSSLHHLGRMDEAVKVGAANLEAARHDSALAGVYALAFLDADDAARAHRCAAWALESDPGSVDALVVQGTLDLARLELGAADERFARVLELAPRNGRAWIGRGTAALIRGDMDVAKTALRNGLEHMPSHVGSWHLLAWTELVTGRIDEAGRLFSRSLELDRNFSESHGGTATVAALNGDDATAKREIEIAKRLDPQCLSAKVAESILKRAANDPDGARDILATTADELAQQSKGPLAALLASLVRR